MPVGHGGFTARDSQFYEGLELRVYFILSFVTYRLSIGSAATKQSSLSAWCHLHQTSITKFTSGAISGIKLSITGSSLMSSPWQLSQRFPLPCSRQRHFTPYLNTNYSIAQRIPTLFQLTFAEYHRRNNRDVRGRYVCRKQRSRKRMAAQKLRTTREVWDE